jgi:hypothetical protein
VIVVGELSGPDLALLSEAQRAVLEFLAKQDDWPEESRKAVMEIFKEVSTR